MKDKPREPQPESQLERDMLAAALRARARWLQENDRITILADSVSIKAWLLAAIRAATAVYEMSRPSALTSAGNEGNPVPRIYDDVASFSEAMKKLKKRRTR